MPRASANSSPRSSTSLNPQLSRLAETFLNWEVMARYAPKILEGTWVTIQLALAVVVAGITAGLVLAVVRTFRIKPLNALIVLVVDVMRALPPLVVIVIFYFALPTVGIRLSAWAPRLTTAACLVGLFRDRAPAVRKQGSHVADE